MKGSFGCVSLIEYLTQSETSSLSSGNMISCDHPSVQGSSLYKILYSAWLCLNKIKHSKCNEITEIPRLISHIGDTYLSFYRHITPKTSFHLLSKTVCYFGFLRICNQCSHIAHPLHLCFLPKCSIVLLRLLHDLISMCYTKSF